MKKLKIAKIEFVDCPLDGIIQFTIQCTTCEFFNGWYSALGYIECKAKNKEDNK